MNIVFLARSLELGGAERQMVLLAAGLKRRGHDVSVWPFYAGGPLRAELESAGVPVRELGKRHRWDLPGFALRVARSLRAADPDVLHGYLVAPNLVASTLKPLLPRTRIVWGIRASDMDFARYDGLARATFALSVTLSRFADLVVVNSESGRRHHVESGFPPERMRVVPNGIDLARFRPDPGARRRLRAEWGIAEGAPLVGLVARLDPMKDHETFLEAAAALAARRGDVRFVCVGGGPDAVARRLRKRASRAGLEGRLVWAGERTDPEAVHAALDVATSSSAFGEGFSNAIAEAMACGVPAAVTDVGDSAAIVGNAGIVVSPRDPAALADAWERLLVAPPPSDPRARIAERYSVEALLDRTERLLSGDPT